jgi:16S rRNA (cytosine1402-N4)-methyltransferase
MTTVYHTPALLKQSIEGLNIKPDGTYADVTFGGGGHSKEILKHLNDKGKLISFDQDEDAFQNIIKDNRFIFVHGNFRYLKNFLKYHNIEKVDGILADLGVSFHHFDSTDRGFSFRFDSDLDMRMNKNAKLKASDILNNYTEEKLADIFYLYGEMHNSRAIARTIIKARENEKIKTTAQLLEILKPFFGREKEKKNMALVFQALRIEVNDEMKVLKKMLLQSLEMLNNGGRLSVITYHSLEDRLVKNFMKSGNFDGKVEKDFFGNILSPFKLINNKVIVPDEEEIEKNPRSRSAKLRIAEKI